MLKRFFIALLLLLVILGAGLSYYLSDDQRLSAQLSSQLSSASGYQVDIQGNLHWQLLPDLALTATNIKLRDGKTQVHVKKLKLGLSLSKLLKSPEQWLLDELILDEVRIKDAGFRLHRFVIKDFALGQAAQFQAKLFLLQGREPSQVRKNAAPIDVSGSLVYALNKSKSTPGTTLSDLTISQTTIRSRIGAVPIEAKCSGSLKELDGAVAKKTDTLDVFSSQMDCTSSEFTISSLFWPKSHVSMAVKDGKLTASLQAANGKVDIKKLKETLTRISSLARKDNPASHWPDTLHYQNLHVEASLHDEQVTAKANMDNLDVTLQGTLAQADGALDLKGVLVVYKATADQLLQLDPLFIDLPLPFYCEATAAKPKCGPNKEAVMPIVIELGKRVVHEKFEEPIIEGAKKLLNFFKR